MFVVAAAVAVLGAVPGTTSENGMSSCSNPIAKIEVTDMTASGCDDFWSGDGDYTIKVYSTKTVPGSNLIPSFCAYTSDNDMAGISGTQRIPFTICSLSDMEVYGNSYRFKDLKWTAYESDYSNQCYGFASGDDCRLDPTTINFDIPSSTQAGDVITYLPLTGGSDGASYSVTFKVTVLQSLAPSPPTPTAYPTGYPAPNGATPTGDYEIKTSGTCASHGCSVIRTQWDCDAGAQAVGFGTSSIESTPDYVAGCYSYEGSGNSIYFNAFLGSTVECSSRDQCVCKNCATTNPPPTPTAYPTAYPVTPSTPTPPVADWCYSDSTRNKIVAQSQCSGYFSCTNKILDCCGFSATGCGTAPDQVEYCWTPDRSQVVPISQCYNYICTNAVCAAAPTPPPTPAPTPVPYRIPPPTAPSNNNNNKGDDSGTPVGAIVGGVLGGLVLCGLVVGSVLFVRGRQGKMAKATGGHMTTGLDLPLSGAKGEVYTEMDKQIGLAD